jgi:hypothetical protein
MIIGKQASDAKEVRDAILEMLRRELVGPSPGYPAVQINGEEILRAQDPPRYRYACGILFPQGVTYSGALDAREEEEDLEKSIETQAEPVSDQDEAPEEEIESPDQDVGSDNSPEVDTEVNTASNFLPSSMGISFLADVSGGVTVDVRWAVYDKRDENGKKPDAKGDDRTKFWFRFPNTASITLTSAQLQKKHDRRQISAPDSVAVLMLDVVSRPWQGDKRLVTVTLLNGTPDSTPINEKCLFQCGLTVRPQAQSVLYPYPGRPESKQDKEELSLSLLYRHRPNYAVGHGCAADWEIADGRVIAVRSEVLPVFEQPPILPRDSIAGAELSMKRLAEGLESEIIKACKALADAYRNWIQERKAELDGESSLSPELKSAGDEHLRNCRNCLRRIEDGITLLQSNGDAMMAFRLMNRAMLEQRSHYALSVDIRTWIKGSNDEPEPSRPYARPKDDEQTRWRPFQLAFILMNIGAFIDKTHPDRKLVDVIWFPTGGGKTEAYLGLAAFVILLRRFQDSDDHGTTVLMRYTLRLLTTQQFQRAASLICALELIRREAPQDFGSSPISIGLWLGGTVTPNRHAAAIHEFGRLQREGGANPFVMLACPWCGAAMGAQPYEPGFRVFGYRRQARPGQDDCIQFRCEDASCEFSDKEGLPLEVVDDGLYERPPTLVIGTVDKFATIPWEPRSRVLFGIDNGASPPTLIIQDELHLISGPLGSMVGHYETVVDEFCTASDGTPAKIVASTATIARAADQIRALYGRDSMLFPPQGLRAGESFFACEGSSSGRTYVGVLASALPSHVTAQVVTLAVLLQAPALIDAPDDAVDPYWTLMCYFNSLRELGRASTLVQADIREYLNSLWSRIGLMESLLPGKANKMRRFINNFDELTSRLRSGDIPAVLQKLFTARPSKQTVDLCYATNMIQVGLDVSRLSLMSIVGQPKGASEYIQASSRVGRDAKKPGLVITNYNPFKPRDRSHFENFRSFHENAYRHVEPTSVTPFAIPVCERAIHALAVAVARCRFQELRDQPDRGVAARRAEITKIVMDRVTIVAPDEIGRAKQVLDRFLDDWETRKPQFYGDMSGSKSDPLIWPAGKPLRPDVAYLANVIRPTPSSLRNVDAECEAVPIPSYPVGTPP